MFRFGWILFMFGMFFGIGGSIYLSVSDNALPLMETYFCEEDETLIRTSRQTYNGESINFYCEHEDGGVRRSVDDKFFLAIGVLLVPLMISLIFIIWGGINLAQRQQKNTMQQAFGQNSPYIDPNGNIYVKSSSASVGDATDVDAVIRAFTQQSSTNLSSVQTLTLKQKLEQLQEAYDAGLITYFEFNERKDRVLDEIAED